MENKDIFVGNYVKVAINPDTSSDNPSYYDPGYIESENVAAFPSIGISTEVTQFEDYREDYTEKLSGDAQIDDTVISVLEVVDDPFILKLDEALENKERIRFRNLYAIDEAKYGNELQSGLFHIFDAYVTKKERTGSNNSVVTNTYTLVADSPLTTGFVKFGRPLNLGEFGVGAGTEEIIGVLDFGKLSGNRWVTVDSTDVNNPFSQGTSSMAIQHPDGQGWELIGSAVGKPAIKIRNKQNQAGNLVQSAWAKVYTDQDKPTPEDVQALPIKGGTVTGSVTINNDLIVKKTATIETATIKTLNTTSISSDSVNVKGAEVYSPNNKPKPIDINAVALGEILDAGTF